MDAPQFINEEKAPEPPRPLKRPRVEADKTKTVLTEQEKNVLHDALPYIDSQYSLEGMKNRVDALISAEMRDMPPFDQKAFDEKYPIPKSNFENTHFVKNELARVSMKEPLEPMDTQRYRLEPPSGRVARDVKAWENAVNNSKSQLEHQSLRLLNLELCNKLGANTWRAQNNLLDATVKQLEAKLAEYLRESEKINRTRKTEQSNIQEKLNLIASEWFEIVEKNVEIDAANQSLEGQIEMYTAECKSKGLL